MKLKKWSVLFMLLIAAQFMFAQNMISGNVIRENKKPLTGVKVTIEGVQGVETFTDQLGNFDIEVPLTAKILIFSFEGMKTQKIGIGKKSFISVTMIAGKDEVPPPPVKKDVKKDEKPKDTAKVKSKDVQDTAAAKKKTKDVKPKDNNKDKSKDNNKDKSKEKSKDKSTSKDTKSTEVKDIETEITQPATTDEKEPAKTTTETKKSKKTK